MCNAQSSLDPCWRVEKRYSNRVLIGNWLEERKKFKRNLYPTSKSCQGIDFVVPFSDGRPDLILGRAFKKKNEGLPKQLLLSHHGELNHKHLVSVYDDHYMRHGNSSLPPLRKFNGNKLAWLPEKSDYPIDEPPTNYGLLEFKRKTWQDEKSVDLRSVYTVSYVQPPPSAFAAIRYAVAPRALSSSLHQHNNLNKNLNLKDQKQLQVPDQRVGATMASLVVVTPPENNSMGP
ncbi:cilia- and flagella-associated protein 107 [Microcaecilia unicolor]|uniref:Uncharacterized protein C1orf158 homolog n=1 Tax=Microcaecilia unicolor TaxID=1415580 RepID=A0A6P7ZXD9_9AMPH|nr:uncharacterized protein C1orf158 homolog [Microcaecilia unicolor]